MMHDRGHRHGAGDDSRYTNIRVDQGYCALHGRRRAVGDLVDDPDRPGFQRCTPARECFQHGGRGGMGGKGGGRGRRQAGHDFLPVRSGYDDGGARGAAPAGHGDAPTLWAPKASGMGVVQAASGAMHFSGLGVGAHEAEVWCAVHGKRVLRGACKDNGGVCFTCLNPSVCMAGSLEAPEALRTKSCRELLCSRHLSLRSTTFLQLRDSGDGYECVAAHPCRHKSIAPGVASGATGDAGVRAQGPPPTNGQLDIFL